jgi:hypothetical protein
VITEEMRDQYSEAAGSPILHVIPDASYDPTVTGLHRSTTQSSVASARASAVWLLKLAGAVAALLLQLALVVYLAYILITQPSKAWPVPIAVVTGATACLAALGRFVSWRMDRADTSKQR